MSATIPKALRNQVWVQYNGPVFRKKCYIKWCTNTIDVFNFHVGHNIPHSKGGSIEIQNLRPICAQCNLSMSDNYTIDDWNKLGGHKVSCFPSWCFTTHRPVVKQSSKSSKSSKT